MTNNEQALRIINIALNGSLLATNETYQRQLKEGDTAIRTLKHYRGAGKISQENFDMTCDFLSISGEDKASIDELTN
ncbi:MAG: hypothetical protein WD607_04445 [Candidatus Paceibacterota bacterium]